MGQAQRDPCILAQVRLAESALILLTMLSMGGFLCVLHAQLQDGGTWKILVDNAGISAMHMAVTRFGTVVMLDRTNIGASEIKLTSAQGCRHNSAELVLKTDCTAHSVEFTPELAGGTNVSGIRPLAIQTDTWCSSGQFQSDGTLVQTGGDYDGLQKVRYFTPCNDGLCDWVESEGNLLQDGRWYASNQLLPDNRQIVVGGRSVFTLEYIPANGEGTTYLPLLSQTRNFDQDNLYPYVHLLPSGNLFIFANRDSIIYNYKTDSVVKTLPTLPGEPRNYPSAGSSVLLPLVASDGYTEAQVLICGGAQLGAFRDSAAQLGASQTCGRITLSTVNGEEPQWKMETMPYRRTMGDMLLLPTRDVLIINGAQNGSQGWGLASNPAFHPVLYKPSGSVGQRFVTLTASDIPRLYHSTAVLLPDGRILVAGSNIHQLYTFSGQYPTELRVEAFSPNYLDERFDYLRPTINSSPNQIVYGQDFDVVVSIACACLVTSTSNTLGHLEISLVSLPFTTHSYAMGLRVLRLLLISISPASMTSGGGLYRISARAPPSSTIAPAGYYMLFALNHKIPGTSVSIHISA